MLINVGGGDPGSGPVAGIHWHMNLGNQIMFIARDKQRQVIPWIRVQDRSGNVTEYYDRTRRLSADQVASSEKRRMDCIDCHNRPAHTYLPPDVAVDQSLAAETCHKANEPFKHPINLGDISMFQCVECHPKQ
jgi:hypothetical protein